MKQMNLYYFIYDNYAKSADTTLINVLTFRLV